MRSQAFIRTMLAFAILIMRFEGFFLPGSRAQRNNNPGNLKNWDPNLPKDDQGFDIFPTFAAGFRALLLQIEKNFNRDLTIWEFFNGKPGVYPGYDATNPGAYARFVADRLDVSVHSNILQLIAGLERFA